MRALKPAFFAALLAIGWSCGSGVVRADLSGASHEIPIIVSPTMDLVQPGRAEWRGEQAEVTFEGLIEQGSAPLSQVTVDGRVRPLQANGRFIAPVTAIPGINIVGVDSVAPDGGRVADVRSFFAGETVAHGEMLPSAMRLILSRAVLDDDDPDVDDLARMGELVLNDFEFKAGMVDPFELGIAVMDPTAMDFDDAEVDILPTYGGVILDITVYDVDIPFDLAIDLGLGTVDSTGFITAHSLSVTMDLLVRVHQGRLVLAATGVDAWFEDFSLALGSLGDDEPGLAETLGSLARSSVQTRLQTRIIETMTLAAAELSDNLAMSTELLDGALEISLELQELEVSPAGISIDLGAAISATAPRTDLYPGAAGSLVTPGTLTSPPATADGVALVIDDDFVNQLLFAAWYSGYLHGITRTAADLGDSAESMPTAFKPIRVITANVMLPPVVTAREDAGEFFYDVSVGGIDTTLETEDNRRFRSHIGVRFPIGAASNDGSLSPAVDGRTNRVLAKTGCVEAPDGIAPSSVAGMINLMIAPILRSDPVELPDFDAMELGNLVSIAALSHLVLSWRSLTLRALPGNTSYLVLDGEPMFK